MSVRREKKSAGRARPSAASLEAARWPRARAVAHVEGLALDMNCAAAPSHLQTTEAALHAMLDDLRLTNPTYSTVSADVLGWQVWAVSHASTFRRLPETPFSSMYRVPV